MCYISLVMRGGLQKKQAALRDILCDDTQAEENLRDMN